MFYVFLSSKNLRTLNLIASIPGPSVPALMINNCYYFLGIQSCNMSKERVLEFVLIETFEILKKYLFHFLYSSAFDAHKYTHSP